MIHSIKSNNSSFKEIHFSNGMNIVLADRIHNNSSEKQTRNGAGKTTIIEIIHFCLGANVPKDSVFKNEHLSGWSFILELDIDQTVCKLERLVDNPSRIYISSESDIETIFDSLKYDAKYHQYYLSVSNFNNQMLNKVFGVEKNINDKYYPSYRELISYSIRKGLDGYKSSFEFFSRQKVYSVQLCNSYFLNLSIECAGQFQEIKDKKKNIEDFKKLSKTGILGNYNIGELNTEVVSKEKATRELKSQLDSFKVHPQYNEISSTVNSLTRQIHSLTDDCIIKEMLLSQYNESIRTEKVEVPLDVLQDLYKEAGIVFSQQIIDSLDKVIAFHNTIQKNRNTYLSDEIASIQTDINNIKNTIKTLSDKRAELMIILKTHGALDEYLLLQNQYLECKESLELTKERLNSAEEAEDLSNKLKIENGELLIKARKDYNERSESRKKAISVFSNNTEFLYPEPGNLNIDLDETGYKFNIEMKNSRSQGVNYMKIFSYDFMVYEINLKNRVFPDFLIHDSTIFDGVDERQISRALMLAHNKCNELGFQYICMMNSDNVPRSEFDEEFNSVFDNSIKLRISDDSDNGGVLGIRF